MTSDLAGRAWEHRERVMDGFTEKHCVQRLAYFEAHAVSGYEALAAGLENRADREEQADVA